MCFYHNCEWYASIVEEDRRKATLHAKCHECEAWIYEGDEIYTLYMQEHEECSVCSKTECEHSDFGETFSYLRCGSCDKFLAAVEEAEQEAGCSSSEARPALGEMINDINEGGMEEAKRYFKLAAKQYPDLASGGYLGRLWKRMFIPCHDERRPRVGSGGRYGILDVRHGKHLPSLS